ncbi:hypothetical protein B0H10DRAFT_2389167, partial [Mycena sp. CBHHK59/15]
LASPPAVRAVAPASTAPPRRRCPCLGGIYAKNRISADFKLQHWDLRCVHRIFGVVLHLSIPPSRASGRPGFDGPPMSSLPLSRGIYAKNRIFADFKLQHWDLRCVHRICSVVLHLSIPPAVRAVAPASTAPPRRRCPCLGGIYAKNRISADFKLQHWDLRCVHRIFGVVLHLSIPPSRASGRPGFDGPPCRRCPCLGGIYAKNRIFADFKLQHWDLRCVHRICSVVLHLSIPPAVRAVAPASTAPPRRRCPCLGGIYAKNRIFADFKLQHWDLRCVHRICSVVLHLSIPPSRASGRPGFDGPPTSSLPLSRGHICQKPPFCGFQASASIHPAQNSKSEFF